MTARLLVSASPGEARVAAIVADRLTDYAIWRPGAAAEVGDLHRGRILARVSSMAGAFVALDGAEGFLPDSEGGSDCGSGAVLGVRITRAAQGGKGPRLSARLEPAERELIGSGPPRRLRAGPGAGARQAAPYPEAQVLVDDAALAARLRPLLGARLRLVSAAFDAEIEAEVAALADSEVELPGGGRLSIVPTPALVAIDLDAGSLTAERQTRARAQTGWNRGLFAALARQIRLRNLGGAIVVDLAGMAARKRAALAPDLAAALAGDPLGPRLLGFTALGLAEILRPRVHPPLHEMLAGPHAAGLAGLRRGGGPVAGRPAPPPGGGGV